jgi:hypothetical protein
MKTDTKTYLIEFENKTRKKITVPETWKVTFGPSVAGPQKPVPGYQHKMPMALRFYETAEKQRAIFTDVISFRDMSIEIEEEVTSTQEKQGFMECDGVRKATTFQAKTREWVNPDRPQERPALPTDASMFEDEK